MHLKYKNVTHVFETHIGGTVVASSVPSLDGNLLSVTVLTADRRLENINHNVYSLTNAHK